MDEIIFNTHGLQTHFDFIVRRVKGPIKDNFILIKPTQNKCEYLFTTAYYYCNLFKYVDQLPTTVNI